MAMLLHAINQAALVKSTDNSGYSCNMRARIGLMAIIACPECGKKISSHSPICSHCGFLKGEVSEEQLEEFQSRRLRDKIYHLNMVSYVVITVFLAAFGWYWWDSGGFEHRSSGAPFIVMGITAVVYLFIRVLLLRNRQRQRMLRKKRSIHPSLRRKF